VINLIKKIALWRNEEITNLMEKNRSLRNRVTELERGVEDLANDNHYLRQEVGEYDELSDEWSKRIMDSEETIRSQEQRILTLEARLAERNVRLDAADKIVAALQGFFYVSPSNAIIMPSGGHDHDSHPDKGRCQQGEG